MTPIVRVIMQNVVLNLQFRWSLDAKKYFIIDQE